ncbi:MAG: cytochrome c [Hyphomicrobiaceae bacterium]|nr:cytochrome c [Hyphomicrobiaceae bacterium]
MWGKIGRRLVLAVATVALSVTHVLAAERTLTVSVGNSVRTFTARELLARKDVVSITITADVAYKSRKTYSAVPLLALLGSAAGLTFDTLEVRASDGFVSQLPMALIKRAAAGGAVAWVAIEPPGQPWPKVPGKSITAGPFYVVWQAPEKSGVGPEQWPYAVVAFRGVRSPVQRWPQMIVRGAAGADPAVQRGMAGFVKHCLACHKIGGAGEATIGPDLARPMSPTAYLSETGLRLLIRNPAAVRTWPKQEMPAFAVDVLPDRDLDDLIAYLKAVAVSTANK